MGFIVRVLVLSLVLPAACVEPPAPLGSQCDRNTDCQTPYVCRLAKCRKECATARDCPIGSLCVKDASGLGSCRLEDEAVCARESDCPDPLVCRGGECTNECAEDVDCAPGSFCDSETMGCVDLAETACVYDTDCQDLVCAEDRRCRDECRRNRDCREGAVCRGGTCEPFELDPDAGMDGGTDASMEGDASPSDMATDASGAGDAAVVTGPACPAGGGSCTGGNRHTLVDCVDGLCAIVGCAHDYTDCDGMYANGCEVYPRANVDHCGGCGVACGAGEICADGCLTGRVEQLELGWNSSCARFSTGHVACWGGNGQGQLGTGFDLDDGMAFSYQPMLVEGLSDAVDLTVSVAGQGVDAESHACAVRAGGEVVCWGYGEQGEVGQVTDVRGLATPTAVSGISDAVEIASGGGFSCARRAGGTVACWGQQSSGRLGNGESDMAAITTPVSPTGLTGATSLMTTNRFYMCAGVGGNEYQCWGGGAAELGTGVDGTPSLVPVAATALSGLGLSGLRGAIGISYGIDGSDKLRCWTENSLQVPLCGTDAFTEYADPFQYATLPDMAQVAPGWDFTLARSVAGEIYCMGNNVEGECGLGRADNPIYPPEAATAITDASEVAAGYHHACALRASGGVWCTGSNSQGQLGRGFGMTFESSYAQVMGLP